MKNIQVYGSGCKNCTVTAERIIEVANDLNQDVNVEKVTNLEDIMKAGVMNTPSVGVDGVIKHSGSVPTVEQIKLLLN